MPGTSCASLPWLRTPRTVDVEITSRCNLRCRYCYFFDNDQVRYDDLPTEEWLTFFDELGSLGVMEVCLAGGEPFVRRDLQAILDGIVRNRMRFSFLSNGGCITDEIAAFVAASGRCNAVQVSLDGSQPETHDACRGTGSFTAAVRGIRTLQKFGVPVTVRMTLTRSNVHDLDATAAFLFEELGLAGFGTNAAGYLGSCRNEADSTLLTLQDRIQAMKALVRLNRTYQGRISGSAGPLADARMWRAMEDARRRGAPGFSNGGHLSGCGCPAVKLAVRADGSIVPCSLLPHVVLGRVNSDPLLALWQSAPALGELRRRRGIPLTRFVRCRDCPYRPYCTGNCPALAASLTGEIDCPSPDGCLRQFLEEGGTIDWLMEEPG